MLYDKIFYIVSNCGEKINMHKMILKWNVNDILNTIFTLPVILQYCDTNMTKM